MTFTELQTEILDRLNLSSTSASTRVGRAINRKYRLITSSIGLQLSRRATVQQTVTIGVSQVIFTNTEKVISVSNRNVSPYRLLKELTIEELREKLPYSSSDAPTAYAIVAQASDSITIEINCVPQTAIALYADVHQAVTDLAGSNEPAFPESFHDIIIEGVIADELRKMEKPGLSQIAAKEYERLLSDLRMWIAKSNYVDIYQGKTADSSSALAGSGSGSSGSVNGALSYTQTGLITFDRDPSAPFAVTASSAVVPNLDADKLDGQHGSFYQNATNINAGTIADGFLPTTMAGKTLTTAIITAPTISSPTLTGVPVAPTAALGTSTTQVATTAFAQTMSSPAFVGVPTAPTATFGTSTTQLATTAFSTSASAPGVSAPSTTGNITLLPIPSGSGPLTIRMNNASLATIQGIAAGITGQELTVITVGAGQVDFTYNDAAAAVGNKIITFATAGRTSLAASSGVAKFTYDGSGRWMMTTHEQVGWLTPTFAAGNFTGNGAMTWTVGSGNISRNAYMLRGRTLTWAFDIGVTTIGGTPNISLQIAMVGGYGVTGSSAGSFSFVNGTGVVGTGVWAATGNLLLLRVDRSSTVNWSAGASAIVTGVATFEVN